MKRKTINIVLAIAALIAVTGYAEYLYLKKIFNEQQTPTEKASPNNSDNETETDLQKKIESLEARNTVLLTLTKEKNRRILELQGNIQKAGIYSAMSNPDVAGLEGFVTLEHSSRQDVAAKLSLFVDEMTKYMDEEQAAVFAAEFGAFIESLNEDISDIPISERKETALSTLQEQLANTTNERTKARLQQRIDAINNASEEDLPKVLSYYQRLEDIQTMNNLMKKFNLGREELREAGIEPPPRNTWGPDPLELAVNMDKFSDMYTPLLPADQQQGFQEDVSSYLDDLTRWHSDAEVLKQKKQWSKKTEKYYSDQIKKLQESTDMNEATKQKKIDKLQRSLTHRLSWLEKAGANRVRSMIQEEKMGELRNLLNEYDIPSSEMKQYGVILRRGRRRH